MPTYLKINVILQELQEFSRVYEPVLILVALERILDDVSNKSGVV